MTSNRWLPYLGVLCAIGPISIDMYLPGAISMAREFGIGHGIVQSSVVGYIAGLLIGQLLYGPLSDCYGRKPALYAGLLLYATSSITCIVVESPHSFIGARFLQGLGGCSGMVVARAIVRDRTGEEGCADAFSSLMVIVGAAPLVAPLIGAMLLEYWSWRSMFVGMSLFGVLCLAITRFCITETRDQSISSGFSFRKMTRAYLHVLADRRFVSFTLCNGLLQSGMYAYIAGAPSLLTTSYGLSPWGFSWAFVANSLGMIAGARINIFLVRRFPLERIIERALWVSAGLGVLTLSMNSVPDTFHLLLGLFLYLASIGFVAPNAAAAAMAKHGENAGAASALMGTMLFGVGALGGVATVVLHDQVVQPLLTVMAASGVGAMLAYYGRTRQRGVPRVSN